MRKSKGANCNRAAAIDNACSGCIFLQILLTAFLLQSTFVFKHTLVYSSRCSFDRHNVFSKHRMIDSTIIGLTCDLLHRAALSTGARRPLNEEAPPHPAQYQFTYDGNPVVSNQHRAWRAWLQVSASSDSLCCQPSAPCSVISRSS